MKRSPDNRGRVTRVIRAKAFAHAELNPAVAPHIIHELLTWICWEMTWKELAEFHNEVDAWLASFDGK